MIYIYLKIIWIVFLSLWEKIMIILAEIYMFPSVIKIFNLNPIQWTIKTNISTRKQNHIIALTDLYYWFWFPMELIKKKSL